jgi:AraC family transcriptional regulator
VIFLRSADEVWIFPMGMHELIAGNLDRPASWPGLRAVYSYLPRWEGCAEPQPNRVKVVFSGHEHVTIKHGGKLRHVSVRPGACYIIGAEPTQLLQVKEHSETLDLFPDIDLLSSEASHRGLDCFSLEPTLNCPHVSTFERDPVLLGTAMRVRRALIGADDLTDIEVSTLASNVVNRLIDRQSRGFAEHPPGRRLGTAAISRVCAFVEDSLSCPITLEAMAALCHLSTWHFARDFKALMGLAPWQYVLQRRIELAKHLLRETAIPVPEVAWSVGYENVSHFRRQFRKLVGIAPGEFRDLMKPSLARESRSTHSECAEAGSLPDST